MKNVFFSILVLFMLAFSILGNVDVNAQPIISLQSLDYNPDVAIKGVHNQVQVSFNIVNTGDQQATVTVTSTRPNKEGSGFLDVPEENIFQGNVLPEDDQSVNFPVSGITVDKDEGDYNAVITVAIEGQESQTLPYTIRIQNLRPAITHTGLDNNEFVITSEEDQIRIEDFTLTNNGNVDLTNLKLTLTGGTFSDGAEVITFRVKFGSDANAAFQILSLDTPVEIQDLRPTNTLLVTIEANMPENIDLDNYVGRIVVSDTTYQANYPEATKTIPVTIKLEPEICSDGRVSNGLSVNSPDSGNLRINIDSPDDNDDFKINDEISIETSVENKENKDMDIIVEATLYDLDRNKKIFTIESDSVEVEKETEEDFDLTMIVPNDEDIDPDNTYLLYIKAFEDGDEDQYCNYDSVKIDLEREDDAVLINSFAINPTMVSQSNTVSFRVDVENIGTDDQRDAYIIIRNQELGLELRSNSFDLKKYDKSGNDKIETFAFTIPSNAEAKDYTIEAIVYFNGGRDTVSTFQTLKVQGANVPSQDNDSDNDGLTDTWEIQYFGNLAQGPNDDYDNDGASNLVEFNSGSSPTAKPGAGPGTYTPTGGSIFGKMDSTKTLFIIGDIILVILAVLFLILIFKKK